MKQGRILVIDDDRVGRKNLSRILSKQGHEVTAVSDGRSALAELEDSEYDLVLTDLVMEGMNGLELLSEVKTAYPGIEVIVFTAYASVSTAIEAVRKGAYHYLQKPVQPEEVRNLVNRALEKIQLGKQVVELETRVRSDPESPVIVGESRQIRDVIRLVREIAKTDCNVLITGESGTGKELAASLIHYSSHRKDKKFLAINCGGFTEELLANELFGHEKGAFTGASNLKPGLLEAASGGTLLLDEIGDMPLAMQVKLMRAIQEQEVIRVGGNSPVQIDVRIIAATNKDLKKSAAAGLFRSELYYRLNVVSIDIPPLRERKEDIPLLANFFLNRAGKKMGKESTGISEEAMKILVMYDYPGNVRELENIIERAVAVSHLELIIPEDLPPDLGDIEVFSYETDDSNIKTLKEIQRDYIHWVLNRTGHDKTRAAKLLDIDRTTLWRHVKKYELDD